MLLITLRIWVQREARQEGEILFAGSPEEMTRQNTHTAGFPRGIFSGKQGEQVSGGPAIEPGIALDCNY